MTVDHASRDQLYRSAVEALGREEAETLMAPLPPVDWSELATKHDLEVMEHRLLSHVDRALRLQTQWVFGAVVLLALSLVVAAIVG